MGLDLGGTRGCESSYGFEVPSSMTVRFKEGKKSPWFGKAQSGALAPSSLDPAFTQAASSRSCLAANLWFRLSPALRLSPWPLRFSKSVPRPSLQLAVAIPTLPGHQTLTCEVLDPGHGPLSILPCSWRQQQQQSEEEKAQEAPGVRARGRRGHAQPQAVHGLWGDSGRLSGRISSPCLPRDQSEGSRQQKRVGVAGLGDSFLFRKPSGSRVSLPSLAQGMALA